MSEPRLCVGLRSVVVLMAVAYAGVGCGSGGVQADAGDARGPGDGGADRFSTDAAGGSQAVGGAGGVDGTGGMGGMVEGDFGGQTGSGGQPATGW